MIVFDAITGMMMDNSSFSKTMNVQLDKENGKPEAKTFALDHKCVNNWMESGTELLDLPGLK